MERLIVSVCYTACGNAIVNDHTVQLRSARAHGLLSKLRALLPYAAAEVLAVLGRYPEKRRVMMGIVFPGTAVMNCAEQRLAGAA
jgi:hypothetical protein